MASIHIPDGLTRITIEEAKRRIREASPEEQFVDVYERPDGEWVLGSPTNQKAPFLDGDFASVLKAEGIQPRNKWRPHFQDYPGKEEQDALYTISADEFARVAGLYGFTVIAGLPATNAETMTAQDTVPDRGRRVKRAALIADNRRRWPTIERDLKDAATNGLSEAARDGAAVGWWWEGSAIEWARARNKVEDVTSGPAGMARTIHRMRG